VKIPCWGSQEEFILIWNRPTRLALPGMYLSLVIPDIDHAGSESTIPASVGCLTNGNHMLLMYEWTAMKPGLNSEWFQITAARKLMKRCERKF
jgi:hypothetical protein